MRLYGSQSNVAVREFRPPRHSHTQRYVERSGGDPHGERVPCLSASKNDPDYQWQADFHSNDTRRSGRQISGSSIPAPRSGIDADPSCRIKRYLQSGGLRSRHESATSFVSCRSCWHVTVKCRFAPLNADSVADNPGLRALSVAVGAGQNNVRIAGPAVFKCRSLDVADRVRLASGSSPAQSTAKLCSASQMHGAQGCRGSICSWRRPTTEIPGSAVHAIRMHRVSARGMNVTCAVQRRRAVAASHLTAMIRSRRR
ncbi:hypothetical protein NA66_104316 [Burkholderia pyrrocinia]|uniref:Uncharacterized protein n=1 Tax=Burkholderia pyrrocinia TaxID=60550 RepID=A0A318HUE5_BURPY|nr:hypothetical protein NA66_104316 [Burkholderia pyrrocinia]SFW90034.1 hypothetical protein SAMN03159384_06927 [Burkholderia sp. NFACC33-1]SFY46388.1 hypothetical protein SAMN03159408_06923 [Burkholderia sp. NFPP32]